MEEKNGSDLVIFANPNVIVSVMVQIQIIILSYLVVINLIAFVLYGIDKKRAMRNEHRIRESVLLWIARLGGAVGSWLGIKIFRHKTKHTKFRFIVPLWMVTWVAGVFYCLFILILREKVPSYPLILFLNYCLIK